MVILDEVWQEYVLKGRGKYAYLRKRADLGSREAQYTVAEILSDIEDESETEEAFKYRMDIEAVMVLLIRTRDDRCFKNFGL